MSISLVAIGAGTAGTVGATPPIPGGGTAGDIMFPCLVNKYPPDGPVLPTGGYSLLAQASGGAGASGANTGNIYSTVYKKIVDGAESSPITISAPSGNSSLGVVAIYRRSAGDVWGIASAIGADNSSGTGLSVLADSTMSLKTGDKLIFVSGWNSQLVTSVTSPTFTATGITFGTATQRLLTNTNFGDNCAIFVADVDVTGGSEVIAPAFSGTSPAVAAGSAVFIRLRELVQRTRVSVGVGLGF